MDVWYQMKLGKADKPSPTKQAAMTPNGTKSMTQSSTLFKKALLIALVLGLIFQSCSLMFLLILTKCSGLIGQKLGQFVWLNRVGQTGAGLIFLGFAVKLAMA